MKLAAGNRYVLTDENNFIVVTSGKAEVYAATRRKISFRQIYLMELTAGEAAFPSLDQFGEIDIVLYTLDDVDFEEHTYADFSATKLILLMRCWFTALIKLPWLRLLADKGDDVLITWLDGTVLSNADDETLWEVFVDNESIFAMLPGVRFKSEDAKLSKRIESRERQKKKILDETIRILLGEDSLLPAEEESDNAKLEEATFIVRRAAKAPDMPVTHMKLSAELVKQLDRPAQKGGMGLRLISLEKGWHFSAVMLGYYGAEKNLAVLLPGDRTILFCLRGAAQEVMTWFN